LVDSGTTAAHFRDYDAQARHLFQLIGLASLTMLSILTNDVIILAAGAKFAAKNIKIRKSFLLMEGDVNARTQPQDE
jgi:hypothetical protein